MKIYLCVTVLIAAVMQISAADAVTCATPPSCADLGYNLSTPIGDKGYACAPCPFDATKWVCSVTSCPSGYQTGVKGTELVDSQMVVSGGTSYYEFTYKYRCHWGFSGGKPCRMAPNNYGTYKFRLPAGDPLAFLGESDSRASLAYVRMCGAN